MKRPHPEIRELLSEIDFYCAERNIPRTRFGIEAVNDGHLLTRLQAGREPRRATIERVRKFMKRKNGRTPT
jgi:hypothetical protein